jgi:hypothetical protein
VCPDPTNAGGASSPVAGPDARRPSTGYKRRANPAELPRKNRPAITPPAPIARQHLFTAPQPPAMLADRVSGTGTGHRCQTPFSRSVTRGGGATSAWRIHQVFLRT